MKKLFFLILLLLFSFGLGKTVDPEIKQLFQKAGYEMTMHPDKAAEVLDYLEKNFKLDHDDKQKLEYLRIKSLFFQNNLNETLKKISDDDYQLSPEIVILKQSILNYLGISSNPYLENSGENDITFSREIMSVLDKIRKGKTKNQIQELSGILKKAKTSNLIIARENLFYLVDFVADNDRNYSNELFMRGIDSLYRNDFQFRIAYAKYLVSNNKIAQAKSIISDLPSETFEQSTNLNLKYDYYDLLSRYYARTESIEKYKVTVEQKDSLLKILNETRFAAKNKWFNILEDNFKNEQTKLIDSRQKILFSILGIGLLIVILITIRYVQVGSQNKEYQNFINRINLLKERKSPQPQVISEKTENLLLKKLDDFEKTDDFIKSDISLQNLAKKLETNTKYLSETINTHKQKNFNAYINELRINYIINKLKEKPIYRSYKIKYLAEESGFSTHSAFAAVFKSVTGMSPANYIQLLKQKEE